MFIYMNSIAITKIIYQYLYFKNYITIYHKLEYTLINSFKQER
jgi:hypothetical protein